MNATPASSTVEEVAMNASGSVCDGPYGILKCVVTISAMISVVLMIVLGNLLVIITVYCDQKLSSQRQNWLIMSLAVADLLVGLLVMPITLNLELNGGHWKLGVFVCEAWLALDVLFVTASILHICAISLDRYFCVTQPLSYPCKRTPFRISLMIGVSWILSFIACIPPVFGWKPPGRGERECNVSEDKGYVIYSSLISFYIPVTVLVAVYTKIYAITVKHSRSRLKETDRLHATLKTNTKIAHIEVELVDYASDDGKEYDGKNKIGKNHVCWRARKSSSSSTSPQHKSRSNSPPIKSAYSDTKADALQLPMPLIKTHSNPAESRRRKLKAKERQATLLLGLILFAFIASWLPFFLMYVIRAFGIYVPELIYKFFFWLGYFNSAVNPVIYTVFNREFKRALCRQLRSMTHFVQPVLTYRL